ncbi:NADH-quinone oxidoreductase subunit NuoG [Candidatus Gillettellia adelgis]
MVMIHIDNKKYDVKSSHNLLQACLSLGFDIPYFCWHPALGSIGACRQCMVKQYQNPEDTRGRLVVSCMTKISDGIFISINDKEAKQFRKNVIEWLMTAHPHDCPVCEEGGNCHLQDMTVMTGHRFRRYRFTKRTHNNQELGPFISHEMNRCISCYRCLRYYKDYADGTDFGVYGMHDNLYFGRVESGCLESEFSGNLVEICPTGVFTDKTQSERYNRKWDMQFSPSICQQCSIGCNTSPGERYGEIRRIENRYNSSINYYFLCDRGRFGYGYVNRQDRPRQPQQLRSNGWTNVNIEQAIKGAVECLQKAKKIIGIGSPRASIESNFALRELVGAKHYYTGISQAEQSRLALILKILKNSGIYTPALHEIEEYDAVLILGEDITQSGARMALSVRQAVKGKARAMAATHRVADWQILAVQNIGQLAKYPLFITNVDHTRLDDIASWKYCAPVDEQARLGFAIAHALDKVSPAVHDLSDDLYKKVDIIVQALTDARKPLIITGSNAGSEAIIKAAANIAKALKGHHKNVGITFLASTANSMGLAMMGGGSLDQALEQVSSGDADTVIVLENDLYRHAPAVLVDAALEKVQNLIVIDHQRTAIMDKAHLILSAASFAESDGTLVNYEGRAQRFFKVYDPSYYDDIQKKDKRTLILESWRWIHALDITYARRAIVWSHLDDVIAACANSVPSLRGITHAAPDASFRVCGQKLARSPHRFSGRTAIRAHISVHEPRQPQDKDTMFAFSMEGSSSAWADHQHIPFAWSPGWNSPQAWNKFQVEVGGRLRYGDPGIRLIEAGDSSLEYFTHVPDPFNARNGWYVAPYYHLFGSDELSQRSSVIQQRMPDAYVMMNPADALQLGINSSGILEFSCMGNWLRLPVCLSSDLSQGQIGLPLGFPGISPIFVGEKAENLRGVI